MRRVDQVLKEKNDDYAKMRDSIMLAQPVYTCVQKDTFTQWLKQQGRFGGQVKVPRLVSSSTYIDQLCTIGAISDR